MSSRINKGNSGYNIRVKSFAKRDKIDNTTLQDKYAQGKIKVVSDGYIKTAKTVISQDLYHVMHGEQTMLRRPLKSWSHPDKKYDGAIILSDGNSKVNEAACRFGYAKRQKGSLSYGKPSIISCPFASYCVNFCYADGVETQYVNSLRIHGHNYLQVYGKNKDEILLAIEKGWALTDGRYKLIRLNDTGDFISVAEIEAWHEFAKLHPDIIVYGYTKNSPHLYMFYKSVNGDVVDNFRITVSDTSDNDKTSEHYAGLLKDEFNVKICHIIDTFDRLREYAHLPYNNGEYYAINYTTDFKIHLHSDNFERGTEQWQLNQLGKLLETAYHLEVC